MAQLHPYYKKLNLLFIATDVKQGSQRPMLILPKPPKARYFPSQHVLNKLFRYQFENNY